MLSRSRIERQSNASQTFVTLLQVKCYSKSSITASSSWKRSHFVRPLRSSPSLVGCSALFEDGSCFELESSTSQSLRLCIAWILCSKLALSRDKDSMHIRNWSTWMSNMRSRIWYIPLQRYPWRYIDWLSLPFAVRVGKLGMRLALRSSGSSGVLWYVLGMRPWGWDWYGQRLGIGILTCAWMAATYPTAPVPRVTSMILTWGFLSKPVMADCRWLRDIVPSILTKCIPLSCRWGSRRSRLVFQYENTRLSWNQCSTLQLHLLQGAYLFSALSGSLMASSWSWSSLESTAVNLEESWWSLCSSIGSASP